MREPRTNGKAEISIPLSSRKDAQSIYSALDPETRISFGRRSSISVKLKGRSIIVTTRADDISAMRAILNSYMRWTAACSEILSTIGKTRVTYVECRR